jgi:hypothetical protein
MSDTFAPLVTSGGRRGCGYRQPGAAYLAVPLGPGGRLVEEFLIDPPVVVDDPAALGLTSVGTAMIERGGIMHVSAGYRWPRALPDGPRVHRPGAANGDLPPH